MEINRSINRKILIFFKLLIILCLFLLYKGNSIQGQGTDQIQADLLIPSINIFKTGNTDSGGHKIKIIVTVKNNCPVIKCVGPFEVHVEYADSLSGIFKSLGKAQVASLCSRPKPTTQRFFDDTIPAGETRQYRVMVDSLRQVDEQNESNNIQTKEYVAK